MDTQLTFRQERFVFEYLHDQNASAAAARAGYTARNMAAQGSELMSNPAIRDRVRFEMQCLLAELRCSAVELMKQRVRAAFFDPIKLIAQGWEPRPLEELDEETRRVVEVSTVMRKSGPVVNVKQPDRHRALRALEKAHERLERLNEQHYARLEKAGGILSLEEIEAMDAEVPVEVAQMPAAVISEKPQVLSGSQPGAGTPAMLFPEKHQVLSGSQPGAETRAMHFYEKPQVPQGDFFQGVFSGSAMGAGTRAMLFPEKRGVLSGLAGPSLAAERQPGREGVAA